MADTEDNTAAQPAADDSAASDPPAAGDSTASDPPAAGDETKAEETKWDRDETSGKIKVTDAITARAALDEMGIEVKQLESNCLPTDENCIKKENEAAAALVMQQYDALKDQYIVKKVKAPVDASGLECSMDGMTKMVKELTEVCLMLVAIVKEMAVAMIPPEFSMAVNYGWVGMVGIGNWMGYLMAATYWLGVEYNFGLELCEFYGYGYYAIEELYKAVSWAEEMGISKDGKIDPDAAMGAIDALAAEAKDAANDLADVVTDAAKAAAASSVAAATETALDDAKAEQAAE